jgi:uncharacterized protein YbjT (DUF2867 family)
VLLITGATGNVGRPLIAKLVESGAKVRAISRNPAGAELPADVEVIAADLASASAEDLRDAFAGVTAVFLNPSAVRESLGEFLAAARDSGVRRVVALSSGAIRDDVDQQDDPLASWHRGIEQAVTHSGMEWTFLRPFEFAVNVIQQWSQQIRYTGMVREAYGQATSSVIHERDVADVAAAALLSEEHVGRTYVLTGPQSLTREQMVAAVAEAIGRPVQFQQIPREAALQAMTQNGLPEPIAESVLTLQEHSVGRAAAVSPAVEEITGHPARSFAEWASDHAEALS